MYDYSNGSGSFADVYKGKWVYLPVGVIAPPPPVAIKILRMVGPADDVKVKKVILVSFTRSW